jgi:hypothetical protein
LNSPFDSSRKVTFKSQNLFVFHNPKCSHPFRPILLTSASRRLAVLPGQQEFSHLGRNHFTVNTSEFRRVVRGTASLGARVEEPAVDASYPDLSHDNFAISSLSTSFDVLRICSKYFNALSDEALIVR